jgi:hypothetical protein
MRIDQTRHHTATPPVDDPIRWPSRPADRNDTTVSDMHRPLGEGVGYPVEDRHVDDGQ